MNTTVTERVNTVRKTILPSRRTHETPRLLQADAYTIGADEFQATKAREKSVYYVTFRRNLIDINKVLYTENDNRIVFVGLQRILERILYKPITHAEIDETVRFLKHAKVTLNGFQEYEFPEQMWRTVVDEFNGYPPIKISAMPEGSIVYPNEPIIMIESTTSHEQFGVYFGEMAAWFESKILHVYGASERATQDRHWLLKLIEMVNMVNPNLPYAEKKFLASLMLTDFGDRAGLNQMESEDLGMTHLYNFGGTDTFSGAYQAWKNSNETVGIFSSVNALAHRNVQAYKFEGDCYKTMYGNAKRFEFLSMVSDCYNYKNAIEKYIMPLAVKSSVDKDDKILVARPDSGDPKEQILWSIRLAIKNGLYRKETINGKEWYFGTTFRMIEGDGMTHEVMWDIMMAMIEEGFAPYGWLLFGVGGGNRNSLKRDNLSAKYALCAVGYDYSPVCKFSETMGKTTLGGYFKVLRNPEALKNCTTIVNNDEEGENAMVVYYNVYDNESMYTPFGINGGQEDDFNVIKARIDNQFEFMPLTLKTDNNHNYPASDKILNIRRKLLNKYDPSKNGSDY